MIDPFAYIIWCIVIIEWLLVFAYFEWFDWLPRLRIMRPIVRLADVLADGTQRLIDEVQRFVDFLGGRTDRLIDALVGRLTRRNR
jgi:hypothetical protein